MGDGEDKGSGEGEGDARDEVSAGSSSVPRKAAGGRAVGTASTMASAMRVGCQTTPRRQLSEVVGAETYGHAASRFRYVDLDIK